MSLKTPIGPQLFPGNKCVGPVSLVHDRPSTRKGTRTMNLQNAASSRKVLVVALGADGMVPLDLRGAAVLVIAPAFNSRLRHWLSDDDPARRRAADSACGRTRPPEPRRCPRGRPGRRRRPDARDQRRAPNLPRRRDRVRRRTRRAGLPARPQPPGARAPRCPTPDRSVTCAVRGIGTTRRR